MLIENTIFLMLMKLFTIIFSVVYIMDYSGFLFSLSKGIYRLLNPSKEYMGQMLPKPFSCSLCMSFWIILIFTLYSGISLIFSIGIASLSALISILMGKVIGIIIRLIHLIR